MKRNDFFKIAKDSSFWNSTHVICFRYESYPVLFFYELFSFLKKKKSVRVDTLKSISAHDLSASLQQSFLGQTTCYWLGNQVEQSKVKERKSIEKLLDDYIGPHTVIFFVTNDYTLSTTLKRNATIIDLDEEGDKDSFLRLAEFFEAPHIQKKVAFLKQIFTRELKISLDKMCMLMRYFDVTSVSLMKELLQSTNLLGEVGGSLYALSQYLFERKEKKFFALWSSISVNFSDVFWASYWTDQLWRACHVAKLLRSNKIGVAKRISYKLPFSFVNTHWKSYSLQELVNSCAAVYKIDYALKRGSAFCSLDLFFSNFLKGEFKER